LVRLTLLIRMVPFISQMTTSLLLFCHRDIGSSVVIVITGAHDVPVRPGITETDGGDRSGAVHFPDSGLAAAVLPQHVRSTIMVEISDRNDVPDRPGLVRLAAPIRVVPFSFQINPSPVSFCHRRSGFPSPLKSPVALTCQSSPGLPRLPAPVMPVPLVVRRNASSLSFSCQVGSGCQDYRCRSLAPLSSQMATSPLLF
jgi:hypothetical protein